MRSVRRRRPDLPLAKGESVLAWAEAHDGTLVAGSRDALYLGAVRLPWERVEAADWDRDTSVLQVAEVGTWGEQRVVHRLSLDDPRSLLQLVRERVTASIVLQRHVPVTDRRGLRVVARRSPVVGDTPVSWFFEYDADVDPDDPAVRAAASAALAQARADTGL